MLFRLMLFIVLFLEACASTGSDDDRTTTSAKIALAESDTQFCYYTYKSAFETSNNLFNDGRKDIQNEELNREITEVFGEDFNENYSIYLHDSVGDIADKVGVDVGENACSTWGKVIRCNRSNERIKALTEGGDPEVVTKGIGILIHELVHVIQFDRDDNILRWCKSDYGTTDSERYAYKVSEIDSLDELSVEQSAMVVEDYVRCKNGVGFKRDFNIDQASCETLEELVQIARKTNGF